MRAFQLVYALKYKEQTNILLSTHLPRTADNIICPGLDFMKLFFILYSIERGIFHAYKCLNASTYWHFHIYRHDNILEFESKKSFLLIFNI